MSYNYFLYVRKYCILTRQYELYVYKTNSKDILHTMGEIQYRTIEQINRIQIKKYSEQLENWWTEQGQDVFVWEDKYKIGHEF